MCPSSDADAVCRPRLSRAPWFTACAIAVLAVAISLATVVFAVVDGVLFRSLPYQRPHELVVLRAESRATPRWELSPVAWQEIESWTRANPDVPWTAVGSRVSDRGCSAPWPPPP
jgi:hypothetical protein